MDPYQNMVMLKGELNVWSYINFKYVYSMQIFKRPKSKRGPPVRQRLQRRGAVTFLARECSSLRYASAERKAQSRSLGTRTAQKKRTGILHTAPG